MQKFMLKLSKIGKYLMSNFNFFKMLYNNSPMDFYCYTPDNKTIIKSVNETSLGYEFDVKLKTIELDRIWRYIRIHKRISAVLIFLAFIGVLYGLVFPNFWHFVNNNPILNCVGVLLIIILLHFIITIVSTKIFERVLKSNFGEFRKTRFKSSGLIDSEYYHLFKFELTKVMVVLLCVGLFISVGSPLKLAHKYIIEGKYNDAIKITSVGSIAFPILPEWYSLRAYAKFSLKDYAGAIKDYDKAYKLETDLSNSTDFDNKIYVKYYTNDYEGALVDFDNAISNAISDYEKDAFLWDKAQFLYNINDYDNALMVYSELLSRADGDRIFLLKDRLYLERAQIYQKLGQDDLAKEDLLNVGAFDMSESIINSIPKQVLILEEI